MARLKEKYTAEIAPALFKQFGYKSTMQIPKIEKVIVNVGCGEARENPKVLDAVVRDLGIITGQKAVITMSKSDISNFKLRKGQAIGAKVTLRGVKMYEFLERLIRISLPRIRDFNGIATKLDGKGNYTLGIKEQIIFPEIDIEKIAKIMGLEITFVTTANTDAEAYALLREFGLPFKKNN